jgi:hypothetical protein
MAAKDLTDGPRDCTVTFKGNARGSDAVSALFNETPKLYKTPDRSAAVTLPG